MRERSRREWLAVLTGGIAGLAGCSGDGTDEPNPTPTATETPVSEETPTATATPAPEQSPTPEQTEQTPTDDEPQLGTADSVATWPSRQGPASNTGWSSTGGPGGDAGATTTASLRDGFTANNGTAVVGSDAIYAIGREAKPYDSDPAQFSCYVYALSRDDGSELWRVTLEQGEGNDNSNIGSDHSLVLGADGLYAIWVGPGRTRPLRVARLATADGSEQWRETIPASAGRALQPAVYDGRLYVILAGQVVAFDTDSGREQGRTAERGVDQTVPTVGAGSLAIYHRASNDQPRGLTVFDAEDLSVRWTAAYPNSRTQIPVIAGDFVYLADGDSFGMTGRRDPLDHDPTSLPKRKIRALSLADGSEQWSHTYDTEAIHSAITPGGTSYLTVTDEYVYYALGFPPAAELLGPTASDEELETVREKLYHGPNVVALDRADGSVAWETTVGSQAQVYRPMVAGPDRLYALYRGVEANDEQQQIYVIDRESGDIQGSFGPVEMDRPFAVADGTLYTHPRQEVRFYE